ncbi:MAG TPA: serine/threonine-protein kinase [Phycisphaerae bacterium]|nr:serine/threonine-protein kinase [Phycisphaerae bacterium]
MLVVCDAISFAHRNGVIHRDLKPTNVLVDWRSDDRAPEAVAPGDSPVGSVVKIVDFGLATPISDDGAMNCSMSIALRGAGTLAYMSPERVREPMAAADVRGDVYSIGAMLYELLTGECPHNLSDLGFAAAVLQVCEADIERPARLNRSLQGDLEAILLKALARRSADRYGAVDELAEDLRRYLRREPVSAMRAGVLYDVRRFVSRHRAASALAAGAMALLVGVSIWLAVLYSRADSAEQDARRMAKASQDATSLLLWVLMNAAPSEGPAGDVPVYEVMKTLATELDRGDFDPLIEGEMRHRIGVIFRERGDYPEAERNLSIAAELVAQHLGSDSPQAANCDVALAGLRIAQSQRPDPDRLNHAVDVLRRHAESEAWVRPELAMALQALAHQDFAQERFHEAEAHAREAVQWMGDPDNLSDTRRKLGLQIDLARVLVSLHRTDEADAIYEASLQLAESMLPEDDLLVGTLSEHMASRCLRDQNYAPAETHTARAIEIYEKRLPAGHATTANAYLLRGHIHRARKRYAEAMSDYRKSAAMQAAIHGPTARPVLNVEYAIAKCAEGMGDYDEAVDRFTLVRNEMKSQFPQNAMAIARIEAALKQANDKRDAAQVVAADE